MKRNHEASRSKRPSLAVTVMVPILGLSIHGLPIGEMSNLSNFLLAPV